jgi:hypothetical protein
VSEERGHAYDELYERLGTKDCEKDIHKMEIRERKKRDLNQVKCIMGEAN